MEDPRSHSPAPVGASALPAYVLSAVLTVGLVGALERTDWDAVAHRMHRGYERVYDSVANIHRRRRCLTVAVVALVLLATAAWVLREGWDLRNVCIASVIVVVAFCALAWPGSAHPRYEDRAPRRVKLIAPGRPGYGWLFADETSIEWMEAASGSNRRIQ